MRPRWTHGRAVHHPGPVCGADDGPDMRVSDDPCAVTCEECDDWADVEAEPNDAVCGDPRVFEMLREVTRGASRKIDGVPVDATTAAAILTVYQAASPATRAKIAALPLDRMAALAWRILRPHL